MENNIFQRLLMISIFLFGIIKHSYCQGYAVSAIPNVNTPLTVKNEASRNNLPDNPETSTYRVVARSGGVTEQVIDGFKLKSFGRLLAIAQTGQVLFDATTEKGQVTFLDNKAVAYEGIQISGYTVLKVETEVTLNKAGTYGFTAVVEDPNKVVNKNIKQQWWVAIINGSVVLKYDALNIPRDMASTYFLFWRSPVMFDENGDYILHGVDGMKTHSVVKGQIADESIYDNLRRQKDMVKPTPPVIAEACENIPYDQLLGLKPVKNIDGKPIYEIASSINYGGLRFTDNGYFAFEISWKFNSGPPDNSDRFENAIIAGYATSIKPNYPKILQGDLIVYWQGENAIHVGLIEVVNSETSITVRSKWGAGAVYDHDPDFNPYKCDYDHWTIYRRIINYPVAYLDLTNRLKRSTNHCLFDPNKTGFLTSEECNTDNKGRYVILRDTQTPSSPGHTEPEITSLPCATKGKAERVEEYYSFSKMLSKEQIDAALAKYDCRGFVLDNGSSTIMDYLPALGVCNLTGHHQMEWIIEDGYNQVTNSNEFNSRK